MYSSKVQSAAEHNSLPGTSNGNGHSTSASSNETPQIATYNDGDTSTSPAAAFHARVVAQSTAAATATATGAASSTVEPEEAFRTILAKNGVFDEHDSTIPNAKAAAQRENWLESRGLAKEDWEEPYGLLEPVDTVIIRPYGGEDDDILLNELRPRFVVLYEPNLAFIRRLEVSFVLPVSSA